MIGRSFARPSIDQSTTAGRGTSQEHADGGDLRLVRSTEDTPRNNTPEVSTRLASRNHRRLDLGPILEQLADERMLGDLDAALLDELTALA